MSRNYDETLEDIIYSEFDEKYSEKILRDSSVKDCKNLTLRNYKENIRKYASFPDVLKEKLSNIILDIEKNKKGTGKNIIFEQKQDKLLKDISNEEEKQQIWTKETLFKEIKLKEEDKARFEDYEVEDISKLIKEDWIKKFGEDKGILYFNRIPKQISLKEGKKRSGDNEEQETKKKKN